MISYFYLILSALSWCAFYIYFYFAAIYSYRVFSISSSFYLTNNLSNPQEHWNLISSVMVVKDSFDDESMSMVKANFIIINFETSK